MTYSFITNGNFIDFVHTDNTSLQVETVLKSLHNTSKCVDWFLPEDATRITFTVDEIKYDNVLITEIDFDGTAMNSQDDFETGIEAMFPGLAGGGSSYLVYTALLSQDGTDAPVATVLQNTLGGTVVLTRTALGIYLMTLNGAFPENKTICPPFDTGGFVSIPLFGATPISYSYNIARGNDNEMGISFYDSANGNSVEWSTVIATGSKILVRIFVYP